MVSLSNGFVVAWLFTSVAAFMPTAVPLRCATQHWTVATHGFCGYADGRRSLPRSSPVTAGLIDNLFGRGPPDDDVDDERGKFVRHRDLEPGCAPLGVLCAGFDEEQLEAIAECVEDVWRGPDGAMAQVPIAVLSQDDFGRGVRLRDVLAQVKERDSEIPLRPAALKVPLILLSGFSTVQTSATVCAIGSLGLLGGAPPGVRPMFAAAVPNSLDKTLRALCDEIEGDHLGRMQRAQ